MLNRSISWKSILNIQAANPRMAIFTIAKIVLPQLPIVVLLPPLLLWLKVESFREEFKPSFCAPTSI